MATKKPLIQNVAASFLAMYPGLHFLEEYRSFYNLDPFTHHLKVIKREQLQRMLAPYLESTHDVSITQSTFDSAIMWLGLKCPNIKELNTKEIIFNDNWILNMRSFEMYPYTDEKIFYRIDTPHPTDESTSPRFDKFLREIFVTEDDTFLPDESLIQYAQEMFGYYLLDRIEPPTTFFLVGEGANGKSTLLFLLEQVAGGKEFVMSNSIENLTNSQFDAQELRFKRLNICADEQSKYIKSGMFKQILEGAYIGANIKFEERINFQPRTKHIFATNKMPLFDTIDYGMRRRFKILPFYRRFNPSETDKSLKTDDIRTSVFYPELSGIIKWAVEGAKRLIANNYSFTENAAVEEQMENYEQNVSSVSAFIKENFCDTHEESSEFFSVDRLYRLYTIWCKKNNKKAMASNNFRDDLRRVVKQKPILHWDKVEKRNFRGYRINIQSNSNLQTHPDYTEDIEFKEAQTNLPNF